MSDASLSIDDPGDTPALFRPLMRLALPVLAEQMLSLGVSLTDTFLTGHFLHGPKYLAAMNLMAYALWMITGVFQFVAIGATALTARFVGAGDANLARRVTNQALVVGMLVAAVAVGLGMLLIDRFVDVMQLSDEAAALAKHNLWIILPMVPFVMFEQVGNACLRGAGDTVTGLVAMIAVVGSNALASYLLVTGSCGLPRLGWTGLAVGTSLGYVVGAAIVVARLLRGRAGLQIRRALLVPDRALMRRLLRIGLPGGFDVASVIACHLWFVSVIDRLGELAAGAHGVAIRIEALSYLPGAAFQLAAATLAGQHLGARQPRQAARSILLACLLGELLMGSAALVFFFQAPWLTRLFVDDPEIVAQAAPLLQIEAFGTPALCLLMILTGSLRGAGDTRWPLAVTFIGLLGVRLPLTHLFCLSEIVLPGGWTIAGYDWGVRGAWYAMVIDLYVRCLLVVFRFWQGGWKRIEV